MTHLIFLQETISKQGEEIMALMTENVKLQIIVIENECLMKMIAKLKVGLENARKLH